MTTIRDLSYWVGFNIIPGIGRVKFSQLEGYFGKLENAWRASADDLKTAGLDNNTVKAVVEIRPRIDLAAEMDKLYKMGITVYTHHDDNYPARLREIYDYPPLIYIKGELTLEDERCLAVVGTRNPTVYGKQVTQEIVEDLVHNKITIVSGLARGIDTIAHGKALEAGGRTTAICACGLDTIYPAENAALARAVAAKGALISEYPLGSTPRPDNFPRRNRIMSGISLGVLVIEADQTSGAIITAHMGLEQNREVFAVPGSILSPKSRGTNVLIQEGAKLVRSCSDILEELNLTENVHQLEMKELVPTNDTESQLLQHLNNEPVHIDAICRNSGLPIATISSNLAIMELKGLVKQVSTMNYVLARETREKYTIK